MILGTILANYVFKVIICSRYCIQLTEQAKTDLRQIKAEDPWAAGRFLETLAAIEADPSLMAKLDAVQYGDDEWDILGLEEEARFNRRYLWRLKIYNASRYRLIYGFRRGYLRAGSATIVILGVINRGRAYNANDTDWQNILEGFDEFCR